MKKPASLKKTSDITHTDDTSGGSTGSTGSTVKMVDFISTPLGELSYELQLDLLRKGEAKLGAVILPAVKQSRVLRPSELSHGKYGRGMKAHPLLVGPRWNGADPRLSQKADQSPIAVERYENQLKLTKGLKQKFESSQRPKP